MICYLVRHGKDDSTVRGGWSNHPLAAEGEAQARELARFVAESKDALNIGRIYTSDLTRAEQTARPIAEVLGLPLTRLSAFREANNGVLAGMDNELAKARYPGLYWSALNWEEAYPGGESPKEFFERIRTAWEELTQAVKDCDSNTVLVTHGGVIQVILSLVNGANYTNKDKPRRIPHAELVAIEYNDGIWTER